MLQEGTAALAVSIPGKAVPGVAGHAADAQDKPRVLDAAIRIIEFGPDTADLGPKRLAGHFLEPVTIDHLQVIIEQADEGRIDLVDGKIVDRRVIERPGKPKHAATRVLTQFLQVSERFRFIGIIVHHQDFEIGISGFFEKAGDTGTQHLHAIAGGDDQRNGGRGIRQRIVHPSVMAGGWGEGGLDADPLEVIGHDFFGRGHGVIFLADVHGG